MALVPQQPVTRDGAGKFVKGVSGNPGGKPRSILVVQQAARLHAETAIAALAEIAANPKAPANSRVSAATALLDRGFGRPSQEVEVSRGRDASRDLHQMTDAELIGFALAAGVNPDVVASLSGTSADPDTATIEAPEEG